MAQRTQNVSANPLFRLLGPTLRSSTTLDSLSLRPVNVMRRNPALVVRRSFGGYSWSIGSHDRNLIGWIDWLRLARRSLGAFTAFASTTLLGEEGGDPGAVDEIACASEEGS